MPQNSIDIMNCVFDKTFTVKLFYAMRCLNTFYNLLYVCVNN